jgi:hypothetical protein
VSAKFCHQFLNASSLPVEVHNLKIVGRYLLQLLNTCADKLYSLRRPIPFIISIVRGNAANGNGSFIIYKDSIKTRAGWQVSYRGLDASPKSVANDRRNTGIDIVLLIVAAILAARQVAQFDRVRMVPASAAVIANALVGRNRS